MAKHKTPTTRHYIIGFAASVALTLTAFCLVMYAVLPLWSMMLLLIVLAGIQLFVQLYYFLHLFDETKPRWRIMTFLFAALVVSIVVFGSLWIMTNLSYHHDHALSETDVDEYIQSEELIQR